MPARPGRPYLFCSGGFDAIALPDGVLTGREKLRVVFVVRIYWIDEDSKSSD